MNIEFNATESVEIKVEKGGIPIEHYLRQPQRIVQALAEPSLMKQIAEDRFQLQMRPINFMDIYHFQPTVILRVWSDARGKVYLSSQSCEIRGIEYINSRFSLQVTGELFPCQIGQDTYLRGKANLRVKVDLPPALWLTPRPFLEIAGNGLLKSVLGRIKQRLLNHLIQDYQHWIQDNQLELTSSPNLLPISDNFPA